MIMFQDKSPNNYVIWQWNHVFKPAAFGNGNISLFALEVFRGLDSLVG